MRGFYFERWRYWLGGKFSVALDPNHPNTPTFWDNYRSSVPERLRPYLPELNWLPGDIKYYGE